MNLSFPFEWFCLLQVNSEFGGFARLDPKCFNLAGDEGRRDFEFGRLRRKVKLATLNRVTALDGYLGNATELRGEWPSMPLSRQAAIIAATLDHAVIGPATPGRNTLDPSRITFVWRG